jgi:hypothetical protein
MSYTIQIASLPDYDHVVAEIYWDGKFVAMLSQEGRPSKIALEFPGPSVLESLVSRIVPLEGFSEALDEARRKLGD